MHYTALFTTSYRIIFSIFAIICLGASEATSQDKIPSYNFTKIKSGCEDFNNRSFDANNYGDTELGHLFRCSGNLNLYDGDPLNIKEHILEKPSVSSSRFNLDRQFVHITQTRDKVFYKVQIRSNGLKDYNEKIYLTDFKSPPQLVNEVAFSSNTLVELGTHLTEDKLIFESFSSQGAPELYSRNINTSEKIFLANIKIRDFYYNDEIVSNKNLFFVGLFNDSYSLWKTNGTSAGTFSLNSKIYPESEIFKINDKELFFCSFASNGRYGLCSITGGEINLIGFQDEILPEGELIALAYNPLSFDSKLIIFSEGALTTTMQRQFYLYKSDGTLNGTQRIKHLLVKSDGSIHSMKSTKDLGYFIEKSEQSKLWRTNGEEQGTFPLQLSNGAEVTNTLGAIGNFLLFAAKDSIHGEELWITDGSNEGTKLIKDINPGPLSSEPSSFNGNSKYGLFLNAKDESNEEAMWLLSLNDSCPNDESKFSPGVCGCGVSEIDSDGDSLPDCKDECSVDPLKIEKGICGCGVAETDSDSDNVPDCIDLCVTDSAKTSAGICGCGVSEIDSDGDKLLDCQEECIFDPNKSTPGACGCNISDQDNNNNGLIDCNEPKSLATPTKPLVKVKKDKYTLIMDNNTLPGLIYEIHLTQKVKKNGKTKLITKKFVSSTSEFIIKKKLPLGKWQVSYRIKFGAIESLLSSPSSFTYKNKKKK